MNAQRSPIARTVASIVTDIESQLARGQVVTILPTELRRLLAAARDGDADALRLTGNGHADSA